MRARASARLVATSALIVALLAASCSKPLKADEDAYKTATPTGSPAAVTEGAGPGDSMRTNNVYLFTFNGFPNGFQQTGYYVSSGQPWGGVTTASTQFSNAPAFQVTVAAGRKNTTEAADWFKGQVSGGQMLGAKSSASSPDKLNFAVCGNLAFAGGAQQLTCLGQGSTGAIFNDWWVGGPGYTKRGTAGGMSAICATGGGQTVGFAQTPPDAADDQYNVVSGCS